MRQSTRPSSAVGPGQRLGGSLSAVFTEAARVLRQQEARRAVLKRLGKRARTTPEIAAAIRSEWQG